MAPIEGLDAVIPVAPRPEPTAATGFDFRHEVTERGEDAIRQLAGLEPLRTWPGRKIEAKAASLEEVTGRMLRAYPYWTRALPHLHVAYGGMCAYHARYLELVDTPTTDHFMALRSSADPAARDLMLVYTWSNLRLACGQVNGVKGAIADVLDPFEVGEGWFGIDLGTFATVVGPSAPEACVTAIERTIRALHLDRGSLLLTRRRAATRYWRELDPLPFPCLQEDQPFLAAELRRQGRLNPRDLERFASG